MARRKIVFVIVEGPSDDEALGVLLTRVYDKNIVHVHITHGDVTTMKGSGYSTILAKLGEIIEGYMKSYRLNSTHFYEIVHIVDMDGAYIPDCAIIEDSTINKPIYSLTEIYSNNIQGIINRNATKRDCLNKISSTSKIHNIPYQVYFMSCNLDHVLYNKLNSTEEEKRKNSLSFARKYNSNIPAFVRFISDSNFSLGESYKWSWAFIKEEKHSLERYTNLGICIKKALSNNFFSSN